MDDQLHDIRARHIGLMRTTAATITRLLETVSQRDASTLRDGGDGWTILEVLGHLRDFDGFFRGRAEMICAQNYPTLPAYDHESLAIERAYNAGDLRAMLAEFNASREQTRGFFSDLVPEQWERAGVHPERGHFTLTDAAIQVGHHDVTHLEQIAKILALHSTAS
ncbi:hypothetical protein SE17_30975 [Kouleothrix aurantiaca]|uniref:DinB-like domain-containing protein n=1 Tax=Kouleothrix aurantiaca TaxID=186479 RepID=A0A0N8PRE8_9CHLR|nr:hypothetical protein SE17_30975 [Kouleothrix aurantiaca]